MSVIQTDNARYDAVSTTVATGETNRDMKANNPTIFLNVSDARYMSITTSQTITVRLNGVDMP
jgi:endonuclease YncB( thermonuclease family)